MLGLVVAATFGFAASCAILLELISRYTTTKTNTNPQFLEFQRSYFLVYYLVVLGDWLNAPYLYKLYSSYGFLEEQIAIIYVCGYASSLVASPVANHVASKYRERRVFVAAAFIYSLTSLMKLSSDYTTLIIARIFSGVATTLLFTALKLWYYQQHVELHDFPLEWLDYTVEKTSKGNSALAVVAGLIAYVMTEVNEWGPVAPSVLSASVLCFSCALALTRWTDNPTKTAQLPHNLKKSSEKRLLKKLGQGLGTIARNQDLLQIGLVQALYESVLCLFVFLWTPVLDHHNPPLGVVFSSFMAGTLASGLLYKVLQPFLSPAIALLSTLLAASAAVLFCVFSTEPTREFPVVSFVAFFVFEAISGIYFPVMRDVKRKVGLEQTDSALTTWFRIPLNLLACAGLLFLHTSSNERGTRHLFACCVFIIVLAALIAVKFAASFRTKQQSNEGEKG